MPTNKKSKDDTTKSEPKDKIVEEQYIKEQEINPALRCL